MGMYPPVGSEERVSKDAVRRLFAEYHETGNQDLRDALVVAHLHLARYIAGRFAHRGESVEDLYQVACLALLKAIERFDPSLGLEFSTFATPTLLGELKRYFRDKGWAVKVPRRLQEMRALVTRTSEKLASELGRVPTAAELAQRLGVTEQQILQVQELAAAYHPVSLQGDNDDAGRRTGLMETLGERDGALDRIEMQASLRVALARLPQREQRVLFLRYFEGLSQTETARRLSISQMHVSRLQGRALGTVRKLLGDGLTAAL
jgi:RNA polymerase sigma-B factor